MYKVEISLNNNRVDLIGSHELLAEIELVPYEGRELVRKNLSRHASELLVLAIGVS
jgi:hypothetical protein